VHNPFLNTGSTLAIFRLFGTMPVEKEALNMVSSGPDNTFLISFKIGIGILNGPVDLELFDLEITFSISPAVVGKRKKLSLEEEIIYSVGDFCTYGTLLAKFEPIVEKKLLKAFAIDLGSFNSKPLSFMFVGARYFCDFVLTKSLIPFQISRLFADLERK
jgi:hypothetical protein